MVQGLSNEQIRSKYIALKEEYITRKENPKLRKFKHICGAVTYSESEPETCICKTKIDGKVLHICANGHPTFLESNVLTMRFNCMKCTQIEIMDLPEDIERGAENRKQFNEEVYGIPREISNPDIHRDPEFVTQRNQAQMFGRIIADEIVKRLKENDKQ